MKGGNYLFTYITSNFNLGKLGSPSLPNNIYDADNLITELTHNSLPYFIYIKVYIRKYIDMAAQLLVLDSNGSKRSLALRY